jgi:hypothetical protein
MLIGLLRRGPGDLLLVVLLVALALLALMAAGPPQRPEPYEPPPCRLVPSPAGAWSHAECLRAPARHHAIRVDRRGRPGAGS